MTMNGRPIKTLTISDNHLGNKRVPPHHMIKGLKSIVTKETLDEIDILFISGDFWDKALMLPGDKVPEIFMFLTSLLKACSASSVKVRILEGTPSHDRKQSVYFKVINDALGDKAADLRYYSTVTIDHEEDLGIDILYVPDEWKHSTEKAWEDVVNEMSARGIDKVDYSIMHGMFSYQVPNGINMPYHKEERYLSITRRYVFIGHVHTFSKHEWIICPGSSDRLKHSEEESKGGVYVTSTGDHSKDKIRFIENVYAMPFVTVDVSALSPEDAVTEIAVKLESLGLKAKTFYYRVIIADNDIMRSVYKEFTVKYPEVNWDYKLPKVKKKKTLSEVRKLSSVVKPINKSSVKDLVGGKLKELNVSNNNDIMAELDKLIGGIDAA